MSRNSGYRAISNDEEDGLHSMKKRTLVYNVIEQRAIIEDLTHLNALLRAELKGKTRKGDPIAP